VRRAITIVAIVTAIFVAAVAGQFALTEIGREVFVVHDPLS